MNTSLKILIVGGTGFISGRLVEMLLLDNHQVTIMNRGKSSAGSYAGPRLEKIIADRRDSAAIKSALPGRTFDAVIDFAAFDSADALAAVESFRGITGRYICCSTISVYMVSNDPVCPITEDQDKLPLMDFWPGNPFGMQYGIDKRECEKVLWDAHSDIDFPVTCLRPTYVSGPGDPARRDWFWIQRILDGSPLLVPGSGKHRFHQVYIDDVAKAFKDVTGSPATIGKSYNIAAEENFSLNEYLGILAEILDRKPDMVHAEIDDFHQQPFCSSPEGDVFTFNTYRDAVFSVEAARRDFGYTTTPIRKWMPPTIEWFTELHGKNSSGYSRRSAEVAFACEYREKIHG